MNTIVFGATGGTGAAILAQLLAAGEKVTAFARNPGRLNPRPGLEAPGLAVMIGDVMDAAAVTTSLKGHDRVVVSLGNSQNPFATLFGAKRTTPRDVCEIGTANIIAAMQTTAVRRLVCVSAFGVGATRAQMPLPFKLFYRTVLREQMADKERQETLIRASGLDWTIVQPVGLTDRPAAGQYVASTTGQLGKQTISRADVAAYVTAALGDAATIGRSVALSG